MTLLQFLNKPEYWFRPKQIIQKLRSLWNSSCHNNSLRISLPWGDTLRVDARDAIATSLRTFGVYELAVSEVLWRLVDVGDNCLDIGANIGYMTSLLANRTGSSGRVFSFEPHPKIFNSLKANAELFAGRLQITPFENAVGARDGRAVLVEPSDFDKNQGTASVSSSRSSGYDSCIKHGVEVRRLDSLFPNVERFGVIKVDVEGSEPDVFRGAEGLLRTNRIRDIIWEDKNIFPSESAKILIAHGYSIFQFCKKVFGLAISEPESKASFSALRWENVNLLATRDPCRALKRLSPRGWQCLRSIQP